MRWGLSPAVLQRTEASSRRGRSRPKTLTNFVFALQTTSAGFYNCDYDSDRHAIVSEAGKYSNVAYGASFAYPWLTGAFGPENGTRLPDYATHSFANSLEAEAEVRRV